MKLFTWGALVVALVLFSAQEAGALGSDYSASELETRGVLVRGQKPVHGYWVNWEDVFFYSGDTAAFNRFVAAYAKLEHTKLKVVIHAGTKKAKSPWDKVERDVAADWSLYRWNAGELKAGDTPAPGRVDVWLGSRIKLGELVIPDNVEVASGGEIEAFVKDRGKK
jgi:hypothetical protein